MARVRFHDGNEEPWHKFSELAPAETHSHFSAAELSSKIFVHEMGDEQTLQLTEVQYPPNVSIDLHAHDVDEIFYLLAGALRIGERSLAIGGSVFIARDTLYSLKSGPDGTRFLVFRPIGDTSYVPEAEWKARRVTSSAMLGQG